MKIIQSHDIPSKLMNVILTAKRELIIVSPYVNLTHTKQVVAALVAARKKGVKIDFYIRDEPTNAVSKEQVLSMGITPRLIPNLHAKLYFNESTGIIASLNLLSSSIGNSIEIGGQLETPEELDELRLFVEQFITPHEIGVTTLQPKSAPAARETPQVSREDQQLQQLQFGEALANFLEAKVDRNSYVEEKQDGSLMINAVGNTFTIKIENTSFVTNQLALLAVVSGREADRFPAKSGRHFTSSDYVRFIQRGRQGQYDMIKATRKQKLSYNSLDRLPVVEKKQLLNEIADFLRCTQAFKADYRN